MAECADGMLERTSKGEEKTMRHTKMEWAMFLLICLNTMLSVINLIRG